MAKTMKAAVVREFGKPLTIDEVPIPQVGPGQIQVAIQASGVCHTDLHAAEGDWPVKPNPPFIPGHEGVGFVSAVGAGVKHIKEGDRVGVPGSILPAATVCIALAAGKRCVSSSSTPAIR
jgi:propanol-preferring alcohol dehydrogenase